ncbi:MAG TPA: hypothetical protein VF442_01855 [Sphingobium sp.]
MAVRSPREIIELYWEEVWNKGNVELIREICASPMTRCEAGKVTMLTHDEQVARVQGTLAIKPHFTHEVLVSDDTHVSSVWNMTSESEKYPQMCGIETFRAENGRFTACWNPPYGFSLWGKLA